MQHFILTALLLLAAPALAEEPAEIDCAQEKADAGFGLKLKPLADVKDYLFATDKLPAKLDGDLGLAVYMTQSPVIGSKTSVATLPYGYIDYGRVFARLDTLGIKTIPLGEHGHLEVVGRISRDGFRTDDNPQIKGMGERKNSLPLGIGTYQKTPIGAVNANMFVDAGPSNGAILEATYAAKFDLGDKVTVYPMIGAEYLSKNYVKYYYGVSDQESAAIGRSAYSPERGSFQPSVGAMITAKPFANKRVTLLAYAKCKKLGGAITDSPIVDKDHQCTAFTGGSYTFD